MEELGDSKDDFLFSRFKFQLFKMPYFDILNMVNICSPVDFSKDVQHLPETALNQVRWGIKVFLTNTL